MWCSRCTQEWMDGKPVGAHASHQERRATGNQYNLPLQAQVVLNGESLCLRHLNVEKGRSLEAIGVTLPPGEPSP